LPARIYEGGPESGPTIRYFVDKFPLFFAPASPAFPPVVTLSYVDSGTGTVSGFVTHLGAYQALFQQLSSFRFLYIAPTDAQFPKVRERFEALVKRPLESDMSTEVLRYFDVRQRFEKRKYLVPVTEDFEFLNDAKRRFHGERFERLYDGWVAGTVSENEIRKDFCQVEPHRRIFFETFVVAKHRSHLSDPERKRVNVA
jgi:hypothetical protein